MWYLDFWYIDSKQYLKIFSYQYLIIDYIENVAHLAAKEGHLECLKFIICKSSSIDFIINSRNNQVRIKQVHTICLNYLLACNVLAYKYFNKFYRIFVSLYQSISLLLAPTIVIFHM